MKKCTKDCLILACLRKAKFSENLKKYKMYQDIHFPSLIASCAILNKDLNYIKLNKNDTIIPNLYSELIDFENSTSEDVFQMIKETSSLREILSKVVGENITELEYQMIYDYYIQKSIINQKSLKSKIQKQTKNYITIIGAGISGIITAIKLKEQNLPFIIFEKSESCGGVWRENNYPGCRCDTESQLYSFTREEMQSKFHYATRDEVLLYIQSCIEKFQLEKHIFYNSELKSAKWNENSNTWELIIYQNQKDLNFQSDFLISSIGQLNKPFLPKIKNLSTFSGEYFHSSKWDSILDFKNKKIALVGSGASALQILPNIINEAKDIYIFQKNPHWIFPSNHEKVDLKFSETKLLLLKKSKIYSLFYKISLFYKNYKNHEFYFGWSENKNLSNQIEIEIKALLENHLCSEVKDKDLIKVLTPNYPIFGKRGLIDTGWLKLMNSKKVQLIPEALNEVIDKNKVMINDQLSEVDLIIFATGFKALIVPFEIIGKNNVSMNQFWGGDENYDPRAYLGVTVPGFPNLFFTFGPNTHPGAGSITLHSELQANYIVSAITHMINKDQSVLECKDISFKKYNLKVDERLKRSIWNNPEKPSWYNVGVNKRASTNLPFTIFEYWQFTNKFNDSDYAFK